MLQAVSVLVSGLFYFSLGSTLLGLIRPVLVLWFLARFNRLMVIRTYGLASLMFFLIWTFLDTIEFGGW